MMDVPLDRTDATVDPERRAVLAGIADAMIPRHERFPSGSDAGIHADGLTATLRARPDLVAPLIAALDSVGTARGAAAVEVLRTTGGHWDTIQLVVSAGYFLNPEVRHLLRYPGQQRIPVSAEPLDPEDELIRSVLARGPVFRPTVR